MSEKLYLPVITAIPTVPLHFHVFCRFVDLLMAFLCDGKVSISTSRKVIILTKSDNAKKDQLSSVSGYKFVHFLRACPPEDQAEVIHAISPISVKLGQIEGHTQ